MVQTQGSKIYEHHQASDGWDALLWQWHAHHSNQYKEKRCELWCDIHTGDWQRNSSRIWDIHNSESDNYEVYWNQYFKLVLNFINNKL